VSWRAAWLGVRRHDIPGPAEHLAGRALTQIGVTHRPEKPGHSDFQDHGRSPYDSPRGLYWALILAPAERLPWSPKCAFTREYGHPWTFGLWPRGPRTDRGRLMLSVLERRGSAGDDWDRAGGGCAMLGGPAAAMLAQPVAWQSPGKGETDGMDARAGCGARHWSYGPRDGGQCFARWHPDDRLEPQEGGDPGPG
jgi:hypothetical protein